MNPQMENAAEAEAMMAAMLAAQQSQQGPSMQEQAFIAEQQAAAAAAHAQAQAEAAYAAQAGEAMAATGAEMVMDVNGNVVEKPNFAPLAPGEGASSIREYRRVPIPPHRMTPLRDSWMKIYEPLVQHMGLQVRVNTKSRHVELRNAPTAMDAGSLTKGADFVHAFMLGFAVEDAMALLRLEDIYVDSFDISDVKSLAGDNMSRAIGRIAGKDGKTKFTIENVTRTRIVLADQRVHILGSFANIKIARDAVVDLILGSPPGKVYSKLRNVASRMNERF